MINSGRLDRRIIIQQKSIVLATNGQQTETWATFLEVWSRPVEKDGFEKTDNNNRSTMRTVFFRVRYNSTITNEMRVVWKGQSYKIEDTKEFGRKEGLIINTSLLTQD